MDDGGDGDIKKSIDDIEEVEPLISRKSKYFAKPLFPVTGSVQQGTVNVKPKESRSAFPDKQKQVPNISNDEDDDDMLAFLAKQEAETNHTTKKLVFNVINVNSFNNFTPLAPAVKTHQNETSSSTIPTKTTAAITTTHTPMISINNNSNDNNNFKTTTTLPNYKTMIPVLEKSHPSIPRASKQTSLTRQQSDGRVGYNMQPTVQVQVVKNPMSKKTSIATEYNRGKEIPRLVDESIDNISDVDREAAKTWTFPTNFAKREYQYSIIEKCLSENTLVCLPTGLGKTFIAAVVMLNFFRWFPKRKVVFVAPTRPLVAQQIKSCCSVMGVASSELCELTGYQPPEKRAEKWASHRIFFSTPQVVANDIDEGRCPAASIVCLVIDEAHKATGRYAYVTAVEKISQTTFNTRIIGLSASPGGNLSTVQEVIDNLHITHFEVRTLDSPDVVPYIHQKKEQSVFVNLGDELESLASRIDKLLKKYLSQLSQVSNCFVPSCGSAIRPALERWRASRCDNQVLNARVEGIFSIGSTLYSLYKQLTCYGIATMTSGIESLKTKEALSKMKQAMLGSSEWRGIEKAAYLIKERGVVHPKILALIDVLKKHFSEGAKDTKVMVFTNYRESANEILKSLIPLDFIKPITFIGQARKDGLKQQDQLRVLDGYNKGFYNVLIATSIGEEGLDIGEVDLVVCFDATSSPTRWLQRIGRTGRKRDGAIVNIITSGYEESAVNAAKKRGDFITRRLKDPRNGLVLFSNPPCLFPDGITPRPVEIEVSAARFDESPTRGARKGKSKSPLLRGPMESAPEDEDVQNEYLLLSSLGSSDIPMTTDKYAASWNFSKNFALCNRSFYADSKIPCTRRSKFLLDMVYFLQSSAPYTNVDLKMEFGARLPNNGTKSHDDKSDESVCPKQSNKKVDELEVLDSAKSVSKKQKQISSDNSNITKHSESKVANDIITTHLISNEDNDTIEIIDEIAGKKSVDVDVNDEEKSAISLTSGVATNKNDEQTRKETESVEVQSIEYDESEEESVHDANYYSLVQETLSSHSALGNDEISHDDRREMSSVNSKEHDAKFIPLASSHFTNSKNPSELARSSSSNNFDDPFLFTSSDERVEQIKHRENGSRYSDIVTDMFLTMLKSTEKPVFSNASNFFCSRYDQCLLQENSLEGTELGVSNKQQVIALLKDKSQTCSDMSPTFISLRKSNVNSFPTPQKKRRKVISETPPRKRNFETNKKSEINLMSSDNDSEKASKVYNPIREFMDSEASEVPTGEEESTGNEEDSGFASIHSGGESVSDDSLEQRSEDEFPPEEDSFVVSDGYVSYESDAISKSSKESLIPFRGRRRMVLRRNDSQTSGSVNASKPRTNFMNNLDKIIRKYDQ